MDPNTVTDLSQITEGVQLGVETIPGVRAPATIVLYATGIELNPAGDVDEFRPDNEKYVQTVTNTRQWSEGALSGRQAYFDQLFLLYGIIGKPTSVVQIATGVYDQIWELRNRQRDNPQTYTIEKGSNERAERATGCFFSGVTWNHSRTSVEIGGSIMGRVFDAGVNLTGDEVQRITVTATGGTFTATYGAQTTAAISATGIDADHLRDALVALSNIDPGEVQVRGTKATGFDVVFRNDLGRSDVTPITLTTTGLTGGSATVTQIQAGTALLEVLPKLIQPQDIDIYMTTSPAGLDTMTDADKLTRCLSANVELTDKYAAVWPINSGLNSFGSLIETAPTFGLTLVVGKLDEGENAAAYFQDRLRDSRYTYVRIAATGEQIGSTGYYLEQDMDFSVRPLMYANEGSDGLATYSQPLRCVPSPEWGGRVARLRLRVPYAGLPTGS